MREVSVNTIRDIVKELCIEANYYISDDIKEELINYTNKEKFEIAKEVLSKIIENDEIAK